MEVIEKYIERGADPHIDKRLRESAQPKEFAKRRYNVQRGMGREKIKIDCAIEIYNIP